MARRVEPATRWVTLLTDGSNCSVLTVDTDGTEWGIRAIAVTVTGVIDIEDHNDNEVSFDNLPVGIYPLAPKAVAATTTATLVGLYGP